VWSRIRRAIQAFVNVERHCVRRITVPQRTRHRPVLADVHVGARNLHVRAHVVATAEVRW